jgi:hypothetical protein
VFVHLRLNSAPIASKWSSIMNRAPTYDVPSSPDSARKITPQSSAVFNRYIGTTIRLAARLSLSSTVPRPYRHEAGTGAHETKRDSSSSAPRTMAIAGYRV